MENFQLISVKWKDHYSLSGWVDISSLNNIEDYINTTTGYKIYENAEYLVISHTLSHDAGTVGDAMFILKSTITEVNKVENSLTGY